MPSGYTTLKGHSIWVPKHHNQTTWNIIWIKQTPNSPSYKTPQSNHWTSNPTTHPPPTSDPLKRLVTIRLTLPHSEATNQDIYISSVYLPAGDIEEDTQVKQLAYNWLKPQKSEKSVKNTLSHSPPKPFHYLWRHECHPTPNRCPLYRHSTKDRLQQTYNTALETCTTKASGHYYLNRKKPTKMHPSQIN